MNGQLSRKQFLSHALAVTGAAALSSVATAAWADEAEGAYDLEYDVVVIGSGFAGCSAAIEAVKAGGTVLMLEKAPEAAAGGNSRVCGQQILDPSDAERAIGYLGRIAEGFQYDEALVRTTVLEMCQNGTWLLENIDPAMDLQPLQYPEFPQVEGSDTMRCWLIDGERSVGKLLGLLMPKINENPAIDVMYEAAAKELVQDPDTREILGVVFESDGVNVKVRAKNGVVMALGGYEGNLQMLQDYCHLKYAYPKGSTYNTGDGVVMAMKAGADLWHMSNPSGPDLNFYDPESKAYFGYTLASSLGNRTAIYVGPDGTRFIDEATMTKHGKMHTHGTYQTAVSALPAYAVFDEAALSAGPICSTFWSEDNSEEVEKGWIKRADTLQELAKMIGVPEDGLVKTVQRFAFYCEQGEDFEFGRPAETLAPLSEEGPYYAMELTPTLTNTQGGARRNANCEVVDYQNAPIPHLYSAGEFGSMYAHGYNGGGNVGEALATGRIAGRNAAKADKGTVAAV